MVRILDYYGLLENTSLQASVKILCPFHEDLKPSLLVNFEKNNWYCFGCGKTGFATDFVRQVDSLNSIEALHKVHKIMNSKNKSKIQITIQEKRPPKELRIEAKEYFYSLPKPSWKNISKHYMISRGFTNKTLIDHDVRINQNTTYPVILPILDMGKFKGWVCRSDKDIDRKYLYNTGFSRQSTLLGEYDKPWVFIAEGYMDWLKARQFGILNSAAILGWKITPKQIEKLSNYTDKVICGLDNTDSGTKGYLELKKHFKVRKFNYPETIKDIGEMDKFAFQKAWQDTIQKANKKSLF
jgi:DNA primase